MKPKLLSLIVITATAWTCQAAAQDEQRETPREVRKEGERKDVEVRERLQAEQRDFREKMESQMKEAMQEATRLEEGGHNEEAEALRAKAKQRLEAAVKEHQTMMQRKTQAAMRDERAGGERRPDTPPPAELEAKLKHLDQAVAHLREAGMPDAAENIARLAEQMRQPMRGADRPRPDQARRPDQTRRPEEPRRPDQARRPEEPRRPDPRLEGEIDALRREVRELQEAVRRMNAEKKN
jgi:hypothetical protein